ncbi:hypothetical protein OPV22_010057 [Ensete ventricosum]|uniref:Uncharacterized protein n=1 Tax=Ensete ventricosum TaxID=4639 RepID=A0AAV8Q1E5_ENSVE|nr:hypothetical protein OPV22_010057 [Ensete ventricosum]
MDSAAGERAARSGVVPQRRISNGEELNPRGNADGDGVSRVRSTMRTIPLSPNLQFQRRISSGEELNSWGNAAGDGVSRVRSTMPAIPLSPNLQCQVELGFKGVDADSTQVSQRSRIGVVCQGCRLIVYGGVTWIHHQLCFHSLVSLLKLYQECWYNIVLAFSYANPLGFSCSIQQDDVILVVAHPFLSWCTAKSAARVEMSIDASSS